MDALPALPAPLDRPPAAAMLAGALSQVMAGVLVALIIVSSVLSYTALLFGSAPPDVQAQGLFAMLLSCVVLGVVGAAFSSLRTTVVSQDGASIAPMAAITAPLVAALAGAPPGVLGATVLTGLAGLSVLTGIVLVAVGRARGGAVVRFLPIQVMAGLLAATGWSLAVGGAGVALGQKLSEAVSAPGPAAAHLLPAAAWAGLMLVAGRRVRSPAVMPALVLGGAALHHLVFGALGRSLDWQREAAWLLHPPGSLAPAFPWTPAMLGRVDWTALEHQVPAIGATAALACLLVLVNASSLELQAKQDIDLDRDLQANGLANLAAGLAGGVMGNVGASRSGMLHRLGVRSRLVPMGAAAAAGLLPMAAPGLVGLAPRWVLGALLLWLGLGLLETWLLKVRQGLSRSEWLTVPAVLAVSVFFGLPAAVFTGLALGCATFAVMYSRGSPIRARYGGDVAQSNVDRSDAERAVLHGQADAVLVLYLQGFLFFGTASRLLAEVKAELARSAGRLRFLVLDCSNIDGLDGSARATLERLHQLASAGGIALSYAALPASAHARLGTLLRPGSDLDVAPTLDAALERVEATLLAEHPAFASPQPFAEAASAAEAAALDGALEPGTVPPGHVLVTQGEASDHLVFLLHGQADVLVSFNGGAPVRVRRFGAGTMIGEIGFLLDTPRTATVRAVTECRILTLTRAAMHRLEREEPGAALALQRSVMARLSRRLLDKDHLIAALVRGSRKDPVSP